MNIINNNIGQSPSKNALEGVRWPQRQGSSGQNTSQNIETRIQAGQDAIKSDSKHDDIPETINNGEPLPMVLQTNFVFGHQNEPRNQ